MFFPDGLHSSPPRFQGTPVLPPCATSVSKAVRRRARDCLASDLNCQPGSRSLERKICSPDARFLHTPFRQ
ncbi:hypothetical protein SKAU_G00317710 [Synaphobranchus kaupii]|uniref:Uncharacterized protein n=1 Tax=Synaphobranchus kaupii TaxID=118154 RepID=A0A9Q1ILW8_SYNKA|nr:hypothetical protein SKAU_G00317710 [Synaphobranchus kaupii]